MIASSFALLLALGLTAAAPEGVHERAQTLLAEERWTEAVEVLQEHLERRYDDPQALELLGRALRQLDRDDEAAHYLEGAVELYERDGRERDARGARKDLARADGLNGRRERIERDLVARLFDAAERLEEDGHLERALDLLVRIQPLAGGKEADEVDALLAKVRAAFEQVDLDEAGGERAEGGVWPLVTLESEHYRLECNLEPDVVRLVADTMDDIHAYYVQIYFDGDEQAARSAKATIRVHPDKDSMLAGWGGGGAPEGWWSPGENRVTCYDTRTSTGTLEWMLETLFHEASHQFMTLLSRKGGWAPAWLNEGTASFFEGAIAMADHRVLWPDAALGRLSSLAHMLEGGSGPEPREVVGFAGGGSYPPEYYPYGWGLVYFLQQYENPETLEYVYRPLYARYRQTITEKGGDSMPLFEQVFVGDDSPLEHAEFADFERDWRRWILQTVKPLHVAPLRERRALRMAEVERYLAAAGAAAKDRKAPVPEDELLRRALLHIEYVRTRIDDEDAPDVELHLTQADVLERLGRPESAAPLLELALDLADEGLVELDEERYAQLEKRLRKLDSRNYALRAARSRMRGLAKTAARLVEDYLEEDTPRLLRAYTFAAEIGEALDDRDGLLVEAARLRGLAREAGLLLGQVRPLGARRQDWATVFSVEAKRLESTPERITVESVRPVGYVDTSFRVGTEYELRARMKRTGEVFMSSAHGLVVAGDEDTQWYVLGIRSDGHLGLWHVERSSGGGAVVRPDETLFLERPVGDDEAPLLTVHVRDRRHLDVTVEGREPLALELPAEYPGGRHVGVYVKDGGLVLEAPVVELYP